MWVGNYHMLQNVYVLRTFVLIPGPPLSGSSLNVELMPKIYVHNFKQHCDIFTLSTNAVR